MAVQLSPDCRDDNHGKCPGYGWDLEADRADVCPCTCHLCALCPPAPGGQDAVYISDAHRPGYYPQGMGEDPPGEA